MNGDQHDLLDLLSRVSADIQAEYQRIRRRAKEDPGTAGDQGEENWASVLRGWLPPSYRVLTKGRVIGQSGVASSQVDIIVPKPAYPAALADKKLFLAAGVAAAFECKTTLKRQHVEEAVRTAAEIKRLMPQRVGTQHQEIHTPLIYGLLAHSHSWKSSGSKPHDIIREALRDADNELCDHPRLQIDLICVANLTIWTRTSTPFVGPAKWGGGWEAMATLYGTEGSIITSFIEHTEPPNAVKGAFNPIGLCIMDVTQRLGWDDRTCRSLANYYKAILSFSGWGVQRPWPPSVFSPGTKEEVVSSSMPRLYTAEFWDDLMAGLIG